MPRRHVARIVVALVMLAVVVTILRNSCGAIPSSLQPSEASPDSGDPVTLSPSGAVPVPAIKTRGPSSDASASRTIASFGWGSGTAQLGRSRPSEANPEAPMSFVAGPDGELIVLDQVNGRILRRRRDGKTDVLKPGVLAPQDLAVARDGTLVVLDRLLDRRVSILRADGRAAGTLALLGTGVSDSGSVTGVFVHGTDVLVESEHGTVVRIGDTSGAGTGTREEMPGRVSRDGRLLLSAGITDSKSGRLWVSALVRATRTHLYTREIGMETVVPQLHLLDSDAHGNVYLAMRAKRATAASGYVVLLVCMIGETGERLATIEIAENVAAAEMFREFSVFDDGTIVHAEISDEGMAYRAYRCP